MIGCTTNANCPPPNDIQIPTMTLILTPLSSLPELGFLPRISPTFQCLLFSHTTRFFKIFFYDVDHF